MSIHDILPWINLAGWITCLVAWCKGSLYLADVADGHEARLKTIESLMSARGLLSEPPREVEGGVERLTNARTTGIGG